LALGFENQHEREKKKRFDVCKKNGLLLPPIEIMLIWFSQN
jgi:hypothetical protein